MGADLRKLRVQAGISAEQAAEVLECSVSKISRLETGIGVPRTRDVRDLIELIGGEAVKSSEVLLKLAEAGRAQPWYHQLSDLLNSTMQRFFDLESGASEELVFGGAWVPGLLQTPSYAEALFRAFGPDRSDEDIKRRVELRMGRKQVLTDPDAPLKLTAIVDESVLLRSVGGPEVMREQLKVFRAAVEDPFDNVEVLLLPFSAGMQKLLAGDLTLLRFEGGVEDVVLAEGHTAQGFEERPEAVVRMAAMFEEALRATVGGTAFVDCLAGLIDELKHAESSATHVH
ncbi:MAG: helix-turn-helix domain-containing protein [Pseudonocardia sp.]